MDVQQHTGGYDCGLFAVAFATALANGAQPENMHFNQEAIRKHLHSCIKNGVLTMFPAVLRKSLGVASTDMIKLNCKCRMPEILSTAECIKCSEWYHGGCYLSDMGGVWIYRRQGCKWR